MASLSILIPSRNEEFLRRTIESILESIRGETEIIAVLDGAWSDPPIDDDPRVTLVYHPSSVGQRAATNEAARLSRADFVMKCDAHCTFDEGFDVKLMETCQDDWIVVPRMYNLHGFNWVCPKCGFYWYQGPDPERCRREAKDGQPGCDHTGPFDRDVIWKPRKSRKSDYMRFDPELRFKYWRAYEKRPEATEDISDLMCFLGACWFLRRDWYWEIGGCDERHGSWGQQGVEMACKGWLSGGRVVVNKLTWFSHLFRTQPGFSFPYPMSGRQVGNARRHSEWLWRENNWERAVRPFSWILEHFWPIEGWTEEQLAEQKARESA